MSRADGSTYDYVFNCGGDTRYNQDDEIYRQRSLKLSVTVATVAAKRGVKCFVELSTGHIYKGDKEPSKENSKTKPWTKLAKWKLEAEGQLEKIEGCVVKTSMIGRVLAYTESTAKKAHHGTSVKLWS